MVLAQMYQKVFNKNMDTCMQTHDTHTTDSTQVTDKTVMQPLVT
jgi:hypothetical protein